ncbi:MAG: TRAP transporter small permease [Synergistaceae bacterium]|nr:TRAP transporter small permease [Synergistaceae bacterium]
MGKIRSFLDDAEEKILISILFVMVIVIFLQVVMRYIFSSSLSWSEELGRYLFIWLTWLSTGYAVRKKRHLRIEVLPDYLSERGKLILDMLAMLIWCGFTIFLINKSFQVTSLVWRRGQITAALEIPTAFTYAAVPVGALVMLLRLIDEIWSLAKKLTGLAGGSEAK